MNNKKLVGAPKKYKDDVETLTLHCLIPKKLKDKCLKAIDVIVKDYKKQ